jgi:ribonuclease D
VRLLATEQELEAGLSELEGAPTYFIDTEFESAKSGKRLSLIQVSRGEEIYIIDALRLPSLAAASPVLFRQGARWVMHAGLQDVELLLRDFARAQPPELFDTQIAWGMSGPEASVSLAFLLFKLLGIRSPKGYQADDWMFRPLPEAQLAYAAADIAHLPALERVLGERMRELGREHLIAEVCRELLLPKPPAPVELGLESFRNAWQLGPAGRAALVLLIAWYNELGDNQRQHVQSRALLSIASRLPTSTKDLSRIKGVSGSLVRNQGAALVARVKQAIAAASAKDFTELEPQAYATFEDYRAEARLALLRVELCAELNIAPDLGLPMALIRRMLPRVKAARSLLPAAEELSGWRTELMRARFLEHAARLDRYPD